MISRPGRDPLVGGGTYLDSGLVQFGDASQLLATVDVWVVTLGKRRFQLLQLFLGEGGAVSPTRRGRWTGADGRVGEGAGAAAGQVCARRKTGHQRGRRREVAQLGRLDLQLLEGSLGRVGQHWNERG